MASKESPSSSPAATRKRSQQSDRQHDAGLVAAIESVRAAVRRQNGTESAIGPKAQRTRERLIKVADELFRARGYNAVSPADIAGQAQVAEATLYQYFSGRSGIFMAVAGEHTIRMLASGVRDWDPTLGEEGFRAFVANYVHLYAIDAAFFRVWEEATGADEQVANLRREFFGAFKRRFASAIRRGVRAGIINPDMKPEELARAMTIGFASYLFDALIFDPDPQGPDEEVLTATLCEVWTSALHFV